MKTIKHELPDFDRIEIHPLADLHIGDRLCDWQMIQERIEYIAKTPNAYCILDGDLMDTAICNSIGDTYSADPVSPMDQLKLCVKIFAPIKDKILAVLPGNHENRLYRFDGIDITEIMCAQLGIPERYSPTSALVFIRFGKTNAKYHHRPQMYSIFAMHGNGGGRREGGKINRLADLATIVDADLYLMGHTHFPAVFKENFFRVNAGNSSVMEVEKLFVNSAAALRHGGYGDRQGYKPASRSNPVIYLDGHKRELRALL